MIEERLRDNAVKALKEMRGKRSRSVNDVFERVLYLSPDEVKVRNYLRRRPVSIFNPGAVIEGKELLVFPRVVFDYYWYVSSVGLMKLGEELYESGKHGNSVVDMDIVLYPTEPWEIAKGLEDPRVSRDGENYLVIHTSVSPNKKGGILPLQGYTILDSNLRVTRKGFLRIFENGEEFVPPSFKDSAVIRRESGEETAMLLRPSVGGVEIGWFGLADLTSGRIPRETMRPVLVFEEWEDRVGWSTNTVPISSNEFLVGWHGVSKADIVYRNGVAIVSPDGELLGVSDYLLEPKGINEFYGDRPGVIFGCGLLRIKDWVYWVGGISDYAIGIFRASIDEVMSRVKWLSG
jgi:predicted GH43/DUF377 family glycosyl hydrolase